MKLIDGSIDEVKEIFQQVTNFDLEVAPDRFAQLDADLENEYSRLKTRWQVAAHVAEPRFPEQPADGETDSNQDFPVVCLTPPRVTIGDTAYTVTETAAKFVAKLVEAKDWISGHSIVNQPSRVVSNMPTEVRNVIESASGKGFRIKRQK